MRLRHWGPDRGVLGGVGAPLLTIKQLSHSLGKGQGAPSTCSWKLVSSEMLNDSHSPHSQTGQLEVMAEVGFALATRPSGKEQDSKADGEVKKSAFPSVLLLLRDLYYGISKIKKTLRKKKIMSFLSEKTDWQCNIIPLGLPHNLTGIAIQDLQHRYLRYLLHKHLRLFVLSLRAIWANKQWWTPHLPGLYFQYSLSVAFQWPIFHSVVSVADR